MALHSPSTSVDYHWQCNLTRFARASAFDNSAGIYYFAFELFSKFRNRSTTQYSRQESSSIDSELVRPYPTVSIVLLLGSRRFTAKLVHSRTSNYGPPFLLRESIKLIPLLSKNMPQRSSITRAQRLMKSSLHIGKQFDQQA